MADRFFAPNLDLAADQYTLVDAEAHHLVTVCRAKPSQMVSLFDGRGNRALAEILVANKRNVICRLVERISSPVPPSRTLAVALPKGDRSTFLVEKCVELGITRLIPLHTQRSVTHPHEAKMARFERAVVEACKQCGRDWLMAVDPLTPFEDLVADTSGDRWLMHPGGAAMSRSTWSMDPTIAIGPEGGFAPDEIERACGAGWQTFAFAGAILRVETAALFAASALARG